MFISRGGPYASIAKCPVHSFPLLELYSDILGTNMKLCLSLQNCTSFVTMVLTGFVIDHFQNSWLSRLRLLHHSGSQFPAEKLLLAELGRKGVCLLKNVGHRC